MTVRLWDFDNQIYDDTGFVGSATIVIKKCIENNNKEVWYDLKN